MAKLTHLILHCTATPEGRIVTTQDIIKWHTAPVSQGGRGWKKVGYSDLIQLDGRIMPLVSYNEDENIDQWEITNGVLGMNAVARHVVYAGGLERNSFQPKDTRTPSQLLAMEFYVKRFLIHHPTAKVAGHNQFENKACPCFDTIKWLRSIGVAESNIETKTLAK